MRIVIRVVGVVATVCVARVIPQSELGTYGIIIIPDAALEALTSVGFSAALIQMKEDATPFLDTAWTFEVFRGVVLFFTKVALAPLWCRFFHVPDATHAMQALALVQLIMAFHSVSSTTLVREMRFDRVFYIYSSEALAYAVAAIPLAFILRDRWALVAAIIFSFVVRVAVSYLVSPVRARFRFDPQKARVMYRYGGWLTGVVFADFLLETTDNAVTGRALGRVALARYRMAYQLATEAPATLEWVISRVAFPALSRLQHDATRVRSNFRALLGVVAGTMIPVVAGVIILGRLFVPLLLGTSWTPVVQPLQILVVAGLIRSVVKTASPLLWALGQTRADFSLKIVQVTIMCTLLYPAAHRWGVLGVSWAVVLAAIAPLPLFVWFLRSLARLTFRDFLLPVISPIIAGGLAFAVVWSLPAPSVTWAAFFAYGSVLVLVYASASWALHQILPEGGFGYAIRAAGR